MIHPGSDAERRRARCRVFPSPQHTRRTPHAKASGGAVSVENSGVWQIFRHAYAERRVQLAAPLVSPVCFPLRSRLSSEPTLSADVLLEQLRGRFEDPRQEVAAAVNQAPAGQVINASEEKVRDLRRTSDRPPIRPRSSSAPTPRKPLFPPPLHPQTGTPLQNKGPDEHTLLTVNGRISLLCRRYAAAGVGSSYPLDSWLDLAEDSLSLGLRELACRLNLASRNFDKAAENLGRAAQVHLSGEFLRQVVESEGKAVQAAAQAGKLPRTGAPATARRWTRKGRRRSVRVSIWAATASRCRVTDAEKRTRRERIKAKCGRGGRKRRPLPKARSGADGSFKEFKIVTFYDDDGTHRLASATRGDCTQAGRLMRRDAARIRLDQADDKVGVVDGSDWIKNQIRRQSLPLDDLGLDFYHLSENLHKTRRAVYGEEDPKDEQAPGNAWVGRLLHTAKHEGYEALRERLQEWKGGLRGTSCRQAAEQVLNYVTDRREMIQIRSSWNWAGRSEAGRRSPCAR